MIINENIEITNEDNMLLMSRYPDNYFDLAIVDPPYGNIDAIGLSDNKKKKKQATKRTAYHLFENIAPEDKYYLELERVSKHQIVWGGNYLGLCGGVIVWDKNGTAFGEGEVAICSTHKSVQIFEYTWNGMLQGDMKNKEIRIHPTQKPVKLYEWILNKYAKENYKILDTHLGSGSIAIAVDNVNKIEKMNLTLTACELDEAFYNSACKRVMEKTNWTSLF